MARKRKKKGAQTADPVAFGASQLGAASSADQAAATDAMRDGMNLFRQAAQNLENVNVEQSKGNLFEYIEAARFNTSATENGSNLVAEVTAAQGQPTAPADIVIKSGDEVVKEVQAKASRSSAPRNTVDL